MTTTLNLSVQYATDAEGIPTSTQFEKWVKAALKQNAEITIRIVDEPESQDLNQKFRSKGAPTNVLTFFYDDTTPPYRGYRPMRCDHRERKPQQQHKVLIAHYAHLTVHGILHLQGFDHKNDQEAAAMEQVEAKIVTALGYDDPY